MVHIHDILYRGHEIIILKGDRHERYCFDIREDEFDGELIHGMYGLRSKEEAIRDAREWIDNYIYDQTHFTPGISL